MKIEQAKNMYSKTAAELQAVIAGALEQLLQRKVNYDYSLSDEPAGIETASKESYPTVCISFVTGSPEKNVTSIFLLPVEFVLQFYAWMISDEPAEELSEDHFEGMKEAVDQIFGQIKMAVADDQASFVLDNMNIFLAENAEQVTEVFPEGEALRSTINFGYEETSFTIVHFTWLNGMEDSVMEANEGEEAQMNQEPVEVQPASFGSLGEGSSGGNGSTRNIDVLMDVDLEVTVELDRKTMLVADLLKLGKGSIVELEKSAGEPLDIYVNGRKFAEGEVVVIDDKFGIRITQLLSPKERVKTLG